jgi:hypothetical protein
MQWLYLAVAVLGAALPLSQLVPFVAAHGLDVPLLFRQLFETHAAAFGVSLALPLFLFFRERALKSE